MGFLWFGNKKDEIKEDDFSKQARKLFLSESYSNVAFKNYAIQICINKIANAIAKCDFWTYEDRKKVEKDTWYLFNIEPNRNENASMFWFKVLYQMVNNSDGALIIQNDSNELLVADSYAMRKYANKENIYTSVSVEGYTFLRPFYESNVLHLKLNNSKVKNVIESIYVDYGKLIGGTIKNYNRSNALKFIAELDGMVDQWKSEEDEEGNNKYDTTMDDLFDNRFASFLSDKDAIMPLEDGIKLVDMNASGSSKSSGSAANKTTRDIAAIFEDVINFCADAFNIPRGLLKGDVADVEAMTDNFISFCIAPIVEQIEDEINRKMYGKENVLSGTKMKIRTDRVTSRDINKLANSAELLSRIGAFSINRILELLDEEPIMEAWADMHIISKNYALVEEALKGGETNGEN